jgi:hypothetical protein
LKRQAGFYILPQEASIRFESYAPEDLRMLSRLRAAADEIGVLLSAETKEHSKRKAAIFASRTELAPAHTEGYALTIVKTGIKIHYQA